MNPAGRRTGTLVTLIAVLLAGAGGWLLAGAGPGASSRDVVVDGVPLEEVHPAGIRDGERRPAVVIAHGFAGSARLMRPFGDTMTALGFVVVLLDFSGHGANLHPLPPGNADDERVLQRDLDTAVRHLRSLSDVDPARIGLLGHSMGAGAVTEYAGTHPEIVSTVAISLPSVTAVAKGLPQRLHLLVGTLEFPNFALAARQAAEQTGGQAVTVPGVEHISILYAPRTHREAARWLGTDLGASDPVRAVPSPLRRPAGAGLLLFGLVLGFFPFSRLVLGSGPTKPPERKGGPLPIGRLTLVAMGSAIAALVLAPLAPTTRLPLLVAGFVVGYTLIAGAVMLGYQFWRDRSGPASPASDEDLDGHSGGHLDGHSGGRLLLATPVLLGYAALTICLPLNLGFTHALPVGSRWWLLGLVWAGFGVLGYAALRLAGGNPWGMPVVFAVTVGALIWAALLGLASGFLLLVVPLLAVLLVGQAGWSAGLRRLSTPAWLIAAVGSLLVAWPIAVTLPVTG